MKILEVKTNAWHEVMVEEINSKDFKILTARRYFFNWKKEASESVVYKLRIVGSSDGPGRFSN